MDKNFNRLIIAAYRLPFKFNKTKKGYKAIQNSGGLVSAILALSEKFKTEYKQENNKIVWTGTADNIPVDLPSSSLENEHFELQPVHLNIKTNDLFYGGFCNDFIWPLFHYFTSYCVFNKEYFEAYKTANEAFCNELVKIVKPGDFIWIHDYQLMLVPEMLRKKMPDANIGFFLHIPFPSFEIFRLVPRHWRESIINGLLGADLLGFHTNDYTQHFLKSVRRTTGFEIRQNIINTHERIVKADAFPIGIDFDKFHDACTNSLVLSEKNEIRNQLSHQKLIFSVDRLDYSKGLLNRLTAYEAFLELNPKWHSKVVFNMVVVPSRDSIAKYKDMKKEIEYTVGRINGKYSSLSWRPIIYQYKSLSFDQLVALYDLSDVGLITPLRDGMNLVAKEYVACQVENKGVLILSEMAGAAAELSEALIINPADDFETANAIKLALEMKQKDKESAIAIMQKRISDYNVFAWAFDFFKQVSEIKEQQAQMNVRLLNRQLADSIALSFSVAKKRILFIDYDGTLVPFTKDPAAAKIEKKTLELVSQIASGKNNTVVIISGRDKEFLEKQFHDINVTLVAEHGYFIKYPKKSWQTSHTPVLNWKESILLILNEYVSRCNGSFLEEKTGSIAWHYRNVESDFAQLRLHELRDDLAEIIRHKTDFEIIEGNKVLEIKSGRYDKGQAAKEILTNNNYDFVFAAGDDKTDEDLFKVLPEHAFSIKVGTSPSFAKYNVLNLNSLVKLLNSFC
jgi:trehalose 6-phosphate synthase/phosphatase